MRSIGLAKPTMYAGELSERGVRVRRGVPKIPQKQESAGQSSETRYVAQPDGKTKRGVHSFFPISFQISEGERPPEGAHRSRAAPGEVPLTDWSTPATLCDPDGPVAPDEFSKQMTAPGRSQPSASLAVAVSGGADSMAMLLLLSDWARATGRSLTALTVDHGLRPDLVG